MDQEEEQREEMDQLFAILALQDELRVKASSENLMAWYVKALKSIEDLEIHNGTEWIPYGIS